MINAYNNDQHNDIDNVGDIGTVGGVWACARHGLDYHERVQL